MKIKLYQIAPEKDDKNLMFMTTSGPLNTAVFIQAHMRLVFDGEVDAKRLEDIFQIFNLRLPEGYRGRSMSVSDVVWAEGLGTFFCDSFGFKQLKKFKGDKCPWRKFDG